MRIAWIAAAAAGMVACARGANEPAQPRDEVPLAFYEVAPGEIAGAPGSIIRTASMPIVAGDVALPPATMYRVMYRSRGLHDEPIAVSAVLVVPKGPPPPGGRAIVAWQHPTTGIEAWCAPSLSPEVARMIPGLAGLLAHGDVVVATDYPGLGTPGPHPYLFGASEGRAVLDAVRAARAFAPAQASARFALWGHSQGGHASLFAATLARTYAPELALVGVAVAAPATGLATLLHVPPGTRVKDSLYAMVLDGWARTMDWPLDDVVRADDVANAQQLSAVCLSPPYAGRAQPRLPSTPDLAFTVRRDITADDPWTDLVAENTPSPPPAGVPVLLAHGGADTIIPPPVTRAFLTQLCAAGSPVRDVSLPGVPHRLVARDAAPQVVAWIEARFAGRAPPDDCGRERPTRSASRR